MKNLFKKLDKIATDIPASEIMVKDIKTINETETAQKAVELMSKHSVSGLIVQDTTGKTIGIVSEGDLLKKVFLKKKSPAKVRISEIMTRSLETFPPEKSIGETALMMKRLGISRLPVVKNKEILGMVTKSDLLEELNEIYRQNRRLLCVAAVITLQFIIIAVLVAMLISK